MKILVCKISIIVFSCACVSLQAAQISGLKFGRVSGEALADNASEPETLSIQSGLHVALCRFNSGTYTYRGSTEYPEGITSADFPLQQGKTEVYTGQIHSPGGVLTVCEHFFDKVHVKISDSEA